MLVLSLATREIVASILCLLNEPHANNSSYTLLCVRPLVAKFCFAWACRKRARQLFSNRRGPVLKLSRDYMNVCYFTPLCLRKVHVTIFFPFSLNAGLVSAKHTGQGGVLFSCPRYLFHVLWALTRWGVLMEVREVLPYSPSGSLILTATIRYDANVQYCCIDHVL